jgi:hypothetical protein
MHTSFTDDEILAKLNVDAFPLVDVRGEELKAAHERIDELKASLAEMVEIYWGEGDGHEPPPAYIQRAQSALSEEVR